MSWGSISISRKIALIMTAMVLVIVVLSIVAGFALSSTVSTFSALIDNETTMMQHANVAKITLLRCRREEKDALYNDDESLVKSIENLNRRIDLHPGELGHIGDSQPIDMSGIHRKLSGSRDTGERIGRRRIRYRQSSLSLSSDSPPTGSKARRMPLMIE